MLHLNSSMDFGFLIIPTNFSMSQFEAAGKELLEWCGDARAYTPHFESNLMQCLHVVNNVTRTGTVGPDLGNLRTIMYDYYSALISLCHQIVTAFVGF